MNDLNTILSSDNFFPHGHCYLWSPEILWLHVGSDALIALAYFAIPALLTFFSIRRNDVPFGHIFFLFAAFILLCGSTHAFSIWTTWSAQYGIEGLIKLATGIVSIATVFVLIPIIPKALNLPNLERSLAELSEKNKLLDSAHQNLRKFQNSVIGREERILSLKREVNLLCKELNKPERYQISE